MTHRARPRVHLLAGGLPWEERRAAPKPGPPKFRKREKKARQPLLEAMKQLALAVKRGDWRAARRARAAAWDEVKKLNPELTRDERRQLGEYKERIRAGEAHDRRKADRDRG